VLLELWGDLAYASDERLKRRWLPMTKLAEKLLGKLM
jgi:hypothetical protein